MSIKFSILELDGVEYFTPTELEGQAAILKAGLPFSIVSLVSDVTTTSATDVLLTDAQLTLSKGKYLVAAYTTANLSTNSTAYFSLYLDGVQLANTLQQVVRPNNATANARLPYMVLLEVNVTSETPVVLDIRWRRDAGTATCYSRFLAAVKKSSVV